VSNPLLFSGINKKGIKIMNKKHNLNGFQMKQRKEQMEKNMNNKKVKMRPIQKIEKNGHNVSRKDGRIKVGIGKPQDQLEGIIIPRRNTKDLKQIEIPEEMIIDYNSLWEITGTGWDTPTDLGYTLYPYICIDGLWFRWDNKFLRSNGDMMYWTEKNRQKYRSCLLKGITDDSPIIFPGITKCG